MGLTVQQQLLILIALSYLAGSIPFGLLIGWGKGIDVRTAGSGNIGASNVGRLLGKKFFFIVLLLDLLKSLVPMVIASTLCASAAKTPLLYCLWLGVGFAAVAGHMFSLFLKFKGGKGVASTGGVILGLWPYYTLAGVITISIWILLFFATRYISIASLGACVAFPVSYFLIAWRDGGDPTGRQLPLLAFSLLVSSMVAWKHRSNIARLRAGTENRMVRKSASSTAR